MKFYTYTGKMIEVTAPSPKAIDSVDIAHALSQIPRASGHFKHFYSVAQHSLNCMREAYARGFSKRVCYACLIHDFSEAYLCDVPTPLKRELEKYKAIENKFEEAILKKYGLYPLSDEEKHMVKKVDEAILYYEFKMLHTIPIHFEKTPVLCSVPDVRCMDLNGVEQMLLRELEGFEKSRKTA